MTLTDVQQAFSKSYVQISAGLTNTSGLAVAAFDLVNCSLFLARSSVLYVHQ